MTDDSRILLPGNKTLVVLLHGYSGSVADFNFLAKQLNLNGYTVVRENFIGHGGDPLNIVNQGSPDDWWTQVRLMINSLNDSIEPERIFVFGLSMGAVFALKAIEDLECVVGGGTFSGPFKVVDNQTIFDLFINRALTYYDKQRYDEDILENNLEEIKGKLPAQLRSINEFSIEVTENLNKINKPLFIAHGTADQVVEVKASTLINNAIKPGKGVVKLYNGAGHVITVNSARRELAHDVIEFIEHN